MGKHSKTVEFFAEDQKRSLFPLTTNAFMIQKNAEGIGDYIENSIRSRDPSLRNSFLLQERVHADKSAHHLRRTAKLDPVAEFYLYDVIYRHRSAFRKRKEAKRISFGYRFVKGRVPPPSESYREFASSVRKAKSQYKYSLAFDVSSYFNSIYHHDLVARFRDLVDEHDEIDLYGRFFREINGGRSLDCLPHGILPAKVIGNDFLSYVEESNRVRCPLTLRFMDDFVLFSNREAQLISDFYVIQGLLGNKGLSVNPAKTRWSGRSSAFSGLADPIKVRLLKKRRALVVASEGPTDQDADDLTEEETEYLLALLEDDEVEEDDAELALVMLGHVWEDVLDHLPGLLQQYPNLSKNAYQFFGHVDDKDAAADLILDLLDSHQVSTEYQLFWFAWTAASHLQGTGSYGSLLMALLEHPAATTVSKAKVLEIPEKRHGMSDIRETQLQSGGAGWLAWASAIGSQCEKAGNRNHLLKYFANASPLNRLIADTVQMV